MAYQIVISEETLNKVIKYKDDLVGHKIQAGQYLRERITGINVTNLNLIEFIQLLLSTKKPCIFAELEVKCNGTDWNSIEFSILGDINVTMNACAYDNGVWSSQLSTKYDTPLDVELLFTPGPMLNTTTTGIDNNPDYKEIVENKEINQEKYNALVERRLLPLLYHTNHKAENTKKALLILPGIGCGNFAGPFIGMEYRLDKALQNIMEKYKFPNIKGVQLGLYAKDFNIKPRMINDTIYEVKGNGLPQLSAPQKYGEEFKNCRLYKVVAWDHVSLPGNDFFSHNSRSTDDGVSAAATNSMEIITGVKGVYKGGKYVPPSGYKDWKKVVELEGAKLIANEGNVKVVSKDGRYSNLEKKPNLCLSNPMVQGREYE